MVDEKDLRDTYLYAFHHLVENGVEAVMMAYNRVNGQPNSTSSSYLNQILIKEWGFKGHVSHLPLTFYRSENDLPAYDSYAMKGRTCRYYNGPLQYPFGFGLSYTTFDYTWKNQPQKQYAANEVITFSVAVKNTGKTDGDEVVQAYIEYPNLERMPIKELKGFTRISVKQGGEQIAEIKIPVAKLQKWDLQKHQLQLYKGEYKIMVGSDSATPKLNASFTISK